MKIDELLKHLENVKIDEDKINEKYEIAEHLAQELGVKDLRYIVHIMTKDMKIYKIRSYKELLKSNKI